MEYSSLKEKINHIETIFLSICEEFGSGMPERFYEKQMKKRIPEIKMQPYYKCYNNISCRPDARINNIILEYKCVDKYNIRQINKYLEFCNADVILLCNFKTKEFKCFY